jgi:Protein of unknown function (DUF3105)
MADRREERERLRQQRLAQERSSGSSERTRLYAGYFVAGLLTLAVVGGLFAVLLKGGDEGGASSKCASAHINPNTGGGSFEGLEPDCREGTTPPALQQGDLATAARLAGCKLEVDLPNEGATHISNSTPFTYKTNPPTSGNHNPLQVADGAYLTPLRPNNDQTANELNVRNFVHSMEHGRIEIHYSSKLPEADQLALKGVFDQDPGGMLLFPDDQMPYQVAATAWTKLLACPTYNERVLDAIRDFRDIYRGQGPENLPI